jgi:hypothetical protein
VTAFDDMSRPGFENSACPSMMTVGLHDGRRCGDELCRCLEARHLPVHANWL